MTVDSIIVSCINVQEGTINHNQDKHLHQHDSYTATP